MKLAPATLPSWLEALRRSPASSGGYLGLFALSATLVLALADIATRPVIAQRLAEDLSRSLSQVVPAALHDGALAETRRVISDPVEGDVQVYRAEEDGALQAVAFELTGYGYSGAIRVLMGIDPAGRILGVRVLSHTETPGLGDKIERAKSDWVEDFAGRSLTDPAPEQWKIQRDGGIFDQFSGASITPRAVVAVVHRGLAFFERQRGELTALSEEPLQ